MSIPFLAWTAFCLACALFVAADDRWTFGYPWRRLASGFGFGCSLWSAGLMLWWWLS